MGAARAKTVSVGGREFVVRPAIAKVHQEIEQTEGTDIEKGLRRVRLILSRTAPDVTEAWLLENADMAEIFDVVTAFREVTFGELPKGEATSP